jgi:hypothetical protein
MSRNQRIGQWDESVATDYLAKHGYEIIARNVRTPFGEIDIIAKQGDMIIFVEVKARFPDDELVRLADMVFDVVPAVLKEQGKAKNPAPNVDAISGTLQYYYGVREFDFYTVLFGVGRALGVTANYVWARALGQPIERPKSVTTKMLKDAVAKAKQAAQ